MTCNSKPDNFRKRREWPQCCTWGIKMYLFLTSVPMVWDLEETLTASLRRTSDEAMPKEGKKTL